uniref:Ribosomal protein eL8/eL30/eS12/Gadd45 domain-containing protein n=1 Tax=Eptatretus burgeri TaxID=7764 RepID=A0A8C4X089_EPTBU
MAAIKKHQEGFNRPRLDVILQHSERTNMVGKGTSNDFSSCNGIVEKASSSLQQQLGEQKSLMEGQLIESGALKQEDCLILHNLHPSSFLSQDELSPASQASLQSVGSLSPPSPPSPPLSHLPQPPPSLHSQGYREYCCQLLSVHIDECVSLLLQQLMQLQEEASAAAGRGGRGGPAGSGRRLVMGLREVTKHLRLGRLEGLIISPNCDSSQGKGGLDEALQTALALAGAQGILVCFALGRKALGRCVNKLVPVSAVGIFSYAGAEALFHRLTRLTLDARQAYQAVVSALQHADEVSRPSGDRSPRPSEEQATAAGRLPFMTHSRNVSAASAVSFCSALSEPISEVNERDVGTSWRHLIEAPDFGLASPSVPRTTRDLLSVKSGNVTSSDEHGSGIAHTVPEEFITEKVENENVNDYDDVDGDRDGDEGWKQQWDKEGNEVREGDGNKDCHETWDEDKDGEGKWQEEADVEKRREGKQEKRDGDVDGCAIGRVESWLEALRLRDGRADGYGDERAEEQGSVAQGTKGGEEFSDKETKAVC